VERGKPSPCSGRKENGKNRPSRSPRDLLEPVRFFRRRRVGGGESRSCGFIPVTCPNIDEFLFLPVAAGMWRQHELWDGTYTLDDLLDITELIRVRRENEARAAEAVRA